MVLRDEKERERLARLSKAIREKTTCRIYRNKLQSHKGEPEINDSDVYLGLSACNREEACGICSNWECLDRFEEHLTHDEQVEFKHCLISSDARTFKKYQIEVSKMIREREDALQRNIEKEIAEKKRQKEIEEQAKIEAQVQRVMSERIDDFTKGELLEIMNGTEEGQRLVAERKVRLNEEMRSAVQIRKNAINIEDGADGLTISDEADSEEILESQNVSTKGSGRLRVFIICFANLKGPEKMVGVQVQVTLFDKNGKVTECVKCYPNEADGGVKESGLLSFKSGVTLSSVPSDWEPGSFLVFKLFHHKVEPVQKLSLKCWSAVVKERIKPGRFRHSLFKKPFNINHLRNIIAGKFSFFGGFLSLYKSDKCDLKVSYEII